MFAIAVNALYTTVRRRGTTRQLASAIVTCVIAALLLLPALVWYNMRFSIEQAAISTAEVELALVYVALFGWFLPLSVTASYCLFALPRTTTTSAHIPRQKRTTRAATTVLNPPRHQPGVEAPYVFGDDTPWGWLEYRGGRFQGQRLALKRSVVTIGRDEDNDIWLDDDMASRKHAELAWDKGQVYLTDCDSMNGVLLNGKRIRGTVMVTANNLLEIGSHRLLFVPAERAGVANEQDDPLLRHVWHSSTALQSDSEKMPMTEELHERKQDENEVGKQTTHTLPPFPAEALSIEAQDTAEMTFAPGLPPTDELSGVLRICNGENTGQCFSLHRALITIGRGSECDIAINDASISRVHAQILRQANGMYVQDLSSRNGTKVNDEVLHAPRRLQAGDIVCVGSIQLAYSPVSNEGAGITTPTPPAFTPPPMSYPMHNSNPLPLRLPSKPKN